MPGFVCCGLLAGYEFLLRTGAIKKSGLHHGVAFFERQAFYFSSCLFGSFYFGRRVFTFAHDDTADGKRPREQKILGCFYPFLSAFLRF